MDGNFLQRIEIIQSIAVKHDPNISKQVKESKTYIIKFLPTKC